MGNNTTTHTTRQRRGHRRRGSTTAALVLAGALVFAACSGDDDDTSAAESEEPASEPAFEGDDSGFVGTADETNDREIGGDFDIGVVGRDVIIEMRVVLSSVDVQRSVSSIMAQASALGGGVASSDVNYGNGSGLQEEFGDQGYAVLVVKVPPQSIDRLLAGLDDTGTVLSINQSAQDVTEQLIDLDVRISNARQSVANVRQFMDRTENLNELVTLEGELTRRQTELERLEAQQRNLTDRVALSTVTIEVVPSTSVPDPVDDNSISDALEQGWDAFTGFVFGIGYVLAVLLPFLVLAAVLGSLGWAIARRRNREPAPVVSSPTTEPTAEPEPDVGEHVSSDDDEFASRPS